MIISDNEFEFLNEMIASKTIPPPKLLIKDHKAPNKEGEFPTRLVVPATNFTAGFSKLGYKGIQGMFERNNINYSKRTIIQSSDLKEKLEELEIKRSEVTIAPFEYIKYVSFDKIRCCKKGSKPFCKVFDKGREVQNERMSENDKIRNGEHSYIF